MGFPAREEAVLNTLTQDVLKSSEIEGEIPTSTRRPRSPPGAGYRGMLTPADRHVEGVVERCSTPRRNAREPLTEGRLFDWHAALFPTACSGMRRIGVADWRDDGNGPMQVVSDRSGGNDPLPPPAADRLPAEMSRFLDWFNQPATIDPVLEAALAHLWFVTIHPFDDGNGRIARAIADMALARSERSPGRFYSMSAQIRQERNDYYEILERTQKGTLDISPWMVWFLGCLDRAFGGAEATLASVLRKARFREEHAGESLNDRQRKVVNRLLDGFEGKLTSSKWASPFLRNAPRTRPTATSTTWSDGASCGRTRMGGRSTSYSLVFAQSEESEDPA